MIRACLRGLLPAVLAGLLPALAQGALSVVSGQFTVDRTPPPPPQATAPADGSVVPSYAVELAVVGSDATSGVAAYQFELVGRQLDWQPAAVLVRQNLADGEYLWRCRVRDRAGNIGDWSDVHAFSYVLDDDSDGDGLPDAWERDFLRDAGFSDGQGDSDGDGLSDAEEYALGSHPFEFYLDLAGGWNLLALPCDTTAGSAAALLAASDSPCWGWNGTDYVQLSAPAAFQGFWVYLERSVRGIVVAGLPPAEPRRFLPAGWQLAGPGRQGVIPTGDGLRLIWRWTGRGYRTVDPAAANPDDAAFRDFEGAWMLSTGGNVDFESGLVP
jgi:hypothetical protein